MADLISIIIPTYNRASIISETLESIYNQSYTNWECIVIDDGSQDNTSEILKKIIEDDKRFKFYIRPQEKKKGANACRNYGYELCKGSFVKWFDSDDLMHPEFLKTQIKILENNPSLDFCACFTKKFFNSTNDLLEDYNPKHTDFENSMYNFIIGNLFFLTPSPLWRKSFLENKLLFDESLYNAHETDFNYRMLLDGAKFIYNQEILVYIRRGHQSIDSESHGNVLSIQSQFDYFKKVFFTISLDKRLTLLEVQNLKKYLLYRVLIIFYTLKCLDYNNNINNFKNVFEMILKTKISLLFKARLFLGTIIVLIFGIGYKIIYIKKFKQIN